MKPSLNSQYIASKIGVSSHTIRRWVLGYPEYFSEEAKSPIRNRAIYTLDEIRVILSIAELSKQGHGLKMIGYKLAEGYRTEASLDDFYLAPEEPKAPPKSKVVQSLEDKVAELTQKHAEMEMLINHRIAELTKELIETKYELGLAKGQLETMKSYQNK